jgi:hypothetical protein
MRNTKFLFFCFLLSASAMIASAQETPLKSPFAGAFKINKPQVAKPLPDSGVTTKLPDSFDSAVTTDDEKPTDEVKPADDSSKGECKLCRWIDLQTATISFRYRYVKSNQRISPAMNAAQPFLPAGEFVRINQGQQQQLYEFDFKFDKAGRFKIHARLSTGEYFTRSFSEVGWGDVFNGENSTGVFARQLYFSAEPIKGVEFQYGGLGINRGENTEHTTYDNDGFITGQRLKIKRPKNFWFDEISVTYAYIGDFYRANFFDRTKRLQESNYHQFLVRKKLNNRIAFSADYTSHATISHLRQGITIQTKEFKLVDSVKAEFYQRLEDFRGVDKGWGYNFQVEKDIKDKVSFTAGLTFTDYRYNVLTTERFTARQRLFAQPGGTLTADRMIRGLSPFVRWDYKVTPYTSFFGFWTTDVAKPTPLPFVYNADHFSVGFQFNLRNVLKKTGLF